MEEDIGNIREAYFDRGYISALVEEATSFNTATAKVDVKVNIKEGKLAYINKIKIQGNAHTRDIVIRRELRMYPGDQFDGAKLRISKQRLKDLGYFEDVGYDIEDTDQEDFKDLVVQVKEAKTGTFSFGGGYSTVDRLVGFRGSRAEEFRHLQLVFIYRRRPGFTPACPDRFQLSGISY